MSLYETEKVRRNIIYKLFESTDTDYKPLEPFRIEIENTTGLSLEAQEFRSHSAKGQAQVVILQNHVLKKEQQTLEEHF